MQITAMDLFETSYWRVLINPDQQYIGKGIVSLKSDKKTLGELSEAEWADFGKVVATYEKALQQAFAPTHFNWQCLI